LAVTAHKTYAVMGSVPLNPQSVGCVPRTRCSPTQPSIYFINDIGCQHQHGRGA